MSENLIFNLLYIFILHNFTWINLLTNGEKEKIIQKMHSIIIEI